MITLGVDCASKQSSVRIMDEYNIIYTQVSAVNVTHSQNLLEMIDNRLKVCGLTLDDIGLISVTKGPGSFTGLRIGMAVVKGIASVRNIPCAGVSSLKALAKVSVQDGVVIPCFDARRSQIYGAVLKGDEVILDDFCENVHHLDELIKNCEDRIIFVGDGKGLCYNTFGDRPNVSAGREELPCIAAGACILGRKEYDEGNAVTHFELTPSYLRLSQAERERMERSESK